MKKTKYITVVDSSITPLTMGIHRGRFREILDRRVIKAMLEPLRLPKGVYSVSVHYKRGISYVHYELII